MGTKNNLLAQANNNLARPNNNNNMDNNHNNMDYNHNNMDYNDNMDYNNMAWNTQQMGSQWSTARATPAPLKPSGHTPLSVFFSILYPQKRTDTASMIRLENMRELNCYY